MTIWCRSFGAIAVRPRCGSRAVGCGGSKGSWSGDQIALSGALFSRESSRTLPSAVAECEPRVPQLRAAARRERLRPMQPRYVAVRRDDESVRQLERGLGRLRRPDLGRRGDLLRGRVRRDGGDRIDRELERRPVEQPFDRAAGCASPSGTSKTRRLESAMRATLSRPSAPTTPGGSSGRSAGSGSAGFSGVGSGSSPGTIGGLEVRRLGDRLRREEDDQPGGRGGRRPRRAPDPPGRLCRGGG